MLPAFAIEHVQATAERGEIRLRGTLGQRPLRVVCGRLPVLREDVCLGRADRSPPASGGRLGVALTPAFGRARKPGLRLFLVSSHQQREPRGVRGVAHPSELALACVRFLRQSPLPVPVT